MTACIGEPISWPRLERYALDGHDAAIAQHLSACKVCAGCLEDIRRDVVALPPLAVPERKPRFRWWLAIVPALAAAALLFVLWPRQPRPPENVATIKGVGELVLGVVRERDGAIREDVLTYQDLMEIGQLVGPRLYSTGPGVFSMDNIRSLEDARDVLRRYSDHYNTKTIKQYLAGDRKVRQWVIMAAKELGLTPTTEGGSNFTMNLTLMQDGYAGLEHALPISPFFGDVVKLGAASGITYTPTLIVSYGGPMGRQYYLTTTNVDEEQRLRRFTPHDELDKWKNTNWNRSDQYVFPLHAKQLAKWVEGGGRIGLGSHGEVQGIGAHWELWMLASGGLKPHAALRAATLGSADAIGFAKDLGSLEVGKLADLIVLDANPLDDIKNSIRIAHVMKNGRLYDASTLDETYPRPRPLGAQWWSKLEPREPLSDAKR